MSPSACDEDSEEIDRDVGRTTLPLAPKKAAVLELTEVDGEVDLLISLLDLKVEGPAASCRSVLS